MGEPWRSSSSWSLVEKAEAALGEPLAHLLLDAPPATLARTREAQLAVLLASLLAWDGVRRTIGSPVAFAGHSLGQITALIASEALTLVDGIRLAARRAECTQHAADRSPGRMVALIGATLEQAEEACASTEGAWVANDNAPGQVVVGGTASGIEGVSEEARRLGVKRVVPLNVGAAFHTPLMAEARDALRPALEVCRFSTGSAPVVSNTDARLYQDADGWGHRLGEHLVSPVLWRSSMQALSENGVDRFIEVGPGSVLGGLARRIVPGVSVRNVAVPSDVSSLMEVA